MAGFLPSANTCCDPCADSVRVSINLTDVIAALIALRFNVINVMSEPYGAAIDGVTNDTAAVQAAYDVLAASGGGVLYFPHGTGRCLCNLTILHDNIVLMGSGVTDVRINTTYGLGPWDTSRPVVQVGNDTDYVDGFGMRGLAIHGDKAGVQCPSCLYFAGGAYNADVQFCQFIGSERTIWFKAGVNYASTLNSVASFAAWEGTISTVEVDDTRSGNPESYCTGSKLTNGHINGHNTTGYAIVVTRGKLNMVNTYLDGHSDHAIYLEEGGNLSCANCDLENLNGEAGYMATVVFSTPYVERDISRFIQGSARIQGKIKWVDNGGTNETQLPVGGGLEDLSNQPSIRKPYIALPMRLGDVTQPFGLFTLDNLGGTINWSQDALGDLSFTFSSDTTNFLGRNDNVSTFIQFDFDELTTGQANVRFFPNTNTTGLCLFDIYRGDGTATVQHRLNGKEVSWLCATAISQVGIGTTLPNAALKVDVESTTAFFAPPRMTEVQRDAVINPPDGAMLYNSTANKLQVRASGLWADLH